MKLKFYEGRKLQDSFLFRVEQPMHYSVGNCFTFHYEKEMYANGMLDGNILFAIKPNISLYYSLNNVGLFVQMLTLNRYIYMYTQIR